MKRFFLTVWAATLVFCGFSGLVKAEEDTIYGLPDPTNLNATITLEAQQIRLTWNWSGTLPSGSSAYYVVKVYTGNDTIVDTYATGKSKNIQLASADFWDGTYSWSVQLYARKSDGLGATATYVRVDSSHAVEGSFELDGYRKLEDLEPILTWAEQDPVQQQEYNPGASQDFTVSAVGDGPYFCLLVDKKATAGTHNGNVLVGWRLNQKEGSFTDTGMITRHYTSQTNPVYAGILLWHKFDEGPAYWTGGDGEYDITFTLYHIVDGVAVKWQKDASDVTLSQTFSVTIIQAEETHTFTMDCEEFNYDADMPNILDTVSFEDQTPVFHLSFTIDDETQDFEKQTRYSYQVAVYPIDPTEDEDGEDRMAYTEQGVRLNEWTPAKAYNWMPGLYKIQFILYDDEANAQVMVDNKPLSIAAFFTLKKKEGESTLAEKMTEGPAVQLYPNPSNGKFQVKLDEKADVDIFGLNGVMVASEQGVSGLRGYELRNSGIYMVRITTADGRTTVKRVVVR